MSYILGSTGSLSRASTPKTLSWTQRRGSRATKRDRPSTPSANSRDDPACVVRPAEYPQVFPAATLDPGLQQAPATATDEVSRFDDHSLAAYLRAFQTTKVTASAQFWGSSSSTVRTSVDARTVGSAATSRPRVSRCQWWQWSVCTPASLASRWKGAKRRSCTESTGGGFGS